MVQTEPTVPAECVRWCQAQREGAVVADDMALVDLDWWNERLVERRIPVRLRGRDLDGAVVAHGKAFLRRGDIADDAWAFADEPVHNLTVLYRAAAWLIGHPDRSYPKRFIDVREWGSDSPLRSVHHALDTYQFIPRPSHDGKWLSMPGVGPQVLSVYLWAAAPIVRRPQLLDQFGVSMLCHLGWTESPVASGYTPARYGRYCNLLHDWAYEARVTPELVEMWLVTKWNERRGWNRGGCSDL